MCKCVNVYVYENMNGYSRVIIGWMDVSELETEEEEESESESRKQKETYVLVKNSCLPKHENGRDDHIRICCFNRNIILVDHGGR